MLCIWCGHGYHVHRHDSAVRRSPGQPLDLLLQQQQQQQQQKAKRQAGSSAGTDLLAAAAKRLAGQAGKPANQGRSMAQVQHSEDVPMFGSHAHCLSGQPQATDQTSS